jgi:two-component system cell cycle response regulator
VESIPTGTSRLVGFLTDESTSLLNREYFMLRLEEEFKKCWRHRWDYSLLLLSVEGLADIEAAEGERSVRSAVLDIAGEILSASRDTDLSTRLDEQRFAILLTGAAASGARAFVERMGQALKDGSFGRYKIHIGGCVGPSDSLRTADDLLARAGEALDRARTADAGQFELIDAEVATDS